MKTRRILAATIGILLVSVACGETLPSFQLPPATIPEGWIDLPDAPLLTRIVSVQGRLEPVLVNRSQQAYNSFTIGCVIERDGRAEIVERIRSIVIDDGVVLPGATFGDQYFYYHLNRLNLSPAGNVIKRCGDGRMTLVGASYDERFTWTAEGARWPERP